jgi:hypothetical protein
MPALKTSAARFLAALAASALFAPAVCAAAQVKVNDEAPLDLQSPPGFTYTIGGSTATLAVATTGFLACANIGSSDSTVTNITMVPQHGQWRFPSTTDLRNVGYGTGTLSIGRNTGGSILSTLTCHSAGAEGESLEPLSDGIMAGGFDSKMVEQYSNLVNWLPGEGFSWSNPDWSLVPSDPCTPSSDQPARADENISCGAVSGIQAGANGPQRGPTLWTYSDLINFYYVVRIDARWGAATGGIGDSGSVLPTTTNLTQTQGGTEYKIVESYSRGVVGVGSGFLGDTGHWCLLASLPAAMDGGICNGAPSSGTLNGPFVSADGFEDNNFPILVGASPGGNPRVSFYMVFVRPIIGAPPPPNQPAVEVSILIDPIVGGVGGDRFKGDDVAFGFIPPSQGTSPGFPWMYGGQ